MTNFKKFVPHQTAAEILKQTSGPDPEMGNLLKRFVLDKDFDPNVVRELSRRTHFGTLFNTLVRRDDNALDNSVLDYFGTNIHALKPASCDPYKGYSKQNQKIDMALSAGFKVLQDQTFFHGRGAAGGFKTPFSGIAYLPDDVAKTNIVIMGYGAAGVLLAYSLYNIGFRNIRVFEKSKKFGIWSRDNVAGGSRNNPRDIEFFGYNLEKAPGDGSEVTRFLTRFDRNINTDEITEIKPGNLKHLVKFRGGNQEEVPIIVNCMGLGKPAPISDDNHMTTNATTTEAGIRWQQQLKAEDVRGKRLVFIGLGNSTAEMLRQVHELQDRGVDVDYVVATHFSRDAVHNPDQISDDLDALDRQIRVFRDVSQPNLVDYQGDLPASRYDYFRALRSGRIITDVRFWSVGDKRIAFYQSASGTGKLAEIKYNQLYTLIGYKQDAETMSKFGCSFDATYGHALYDYDGEFISKQGATSDRAYKGYFGFGAVLDSPFNQNAIVIPGMIHRLGDLLFGITMRAYEFHRQPKKTEVDAETAKTKTAEKKSPAPSVTATTSKVNYREILNALSQAVQNR